MARRYYSSTAVETTLSGSISNSATSITVTALSGFPNTTPWTAILDADTASEELVEVTNVAGTTLTVTRGVDGTAAVSHNAGASFRHGVSARDFDEANDHVNDSTGVHGLGASSSVVGTTDSQTLTNKTISGASNTISNIAQSSVTNLTTDLGNKADAANPTFTGVAQFPDGSAAAPSITNTGDTDTGIAFPADNAVAIATGGTERVRVDASGNIMRGVTSAQSMTNPISAAAVTPAVQFYTTNATGFVAVTRVDASAASAGLILAKARGSAVTSPAAVQSADEIARINFQAHDGTSYVRAAEISATVDGTPGTGDMPGRLGFWTTADGGSSPTERMRIDSNGLITGTGTSLGAWTAYTPTLGGTGWALGNGTIAGAYCQVGKTVKFRLRVVFGSTSTFGASAAPTVTLPLAAKDTTSLQEQAASIGVQMEDVSAGARYVGFAWRNTTTEIAIARKFNTDDQVAQIINSVPFTWATTDTIYVAGTYEAA